MDVLIGALAGYLLIGLTAGLLFTAVESVAPGSFLSAAHPALQSPVSRLDFLRLNTFACVTLTTTGYGDMLPVAPAAQMASVALAIVGNCYLEVVLGLLISRFTVQEQARTGCGQLGIQAGVGRFIGQGIHLVGQIQARLLRGWRRRPGH